MSSATSDSKLIGEMRSYLRAHSRKHGRRRTAEAFGVSRHTLWRFLERGQTGHALPRAVTARVGDTPEALAAATRALAGETRRSPSSRPGTPRITHTLWETLQLYEHPPERPAHRQPLGSRRVARPIRRPAGTHLTVARHRSGFSPSAVLVEAGVGERVARDDARQDTQALEAHPLLLVTQPLLRLHARPLQARRPRTSNRCCGHGTPVPQTPASGVDDRGTIP